MPPRCRPSGEDGGHPRGELDWLGDAAARRRGKKRTPENQAAPGSAGARTGRSGEAGRRGFWAGAGGVAPAVKRDGAARGPAWSSQARTWLSRSDVRAADASRTGALRAREAVPRTETPGRPGSSSDGGGQSGGRHRCCGAGRRLPDPHHGQGDTPRECLRQDHPTARQRCQTRWRRRGRGELADSPSRSRGSAS